MLMEYNLRLNWHGTTRIDETFTDESWQSEYEWERVQTLPTTGMWRKGQNIKKSLKIWVYECVCNKKR